MKYFCIIGCPIEHSLSPAMYNAVFRKLKLDCRYFSFRVEPSSLREAVLGLRALNFSGFNVTLPHKEKIIEYLDELSKEARLIGAVNTVRVGDRLVGYNTDGIGALKSLGNVRGKKVLVLGAGGASRAISFSLSLERAKVTIANRTIERARRLAQEVWEKLGIRIETCGVDSETLKEKISEAEILINCTSVGMYPNIDETLVDESMLRSDLTVMDIVYNPLETRLLKLAKKTGARTIAGVDMLLNQGAESLKIWGISPEVETMKRAVLARLR